MTSDDPGRQTRGDGVVLHEERLNVRPEWTQAGTIRFRKDVEEHPVTEFVPRNLEEASVEHAPVEAQDSGQVEELDDGSISIPVLEEELVVTRRTVVRERLIVRKRTVTRDEPVEATLRRERVEVETEGDVQYTDQRPSEQSARQ